MAEYQAALTVVSRGPALSFAVALAVLAALLELAPARMPVRYGSTLALGSCAVLLGVCALELGTAARFDGAILSHAATLVQMGSLDLSLGFACELMTASVVCALAASAAFTSLRSAQERTVSPRARARVALAAAGGVVSLLAANLIVVIVGWELLALAAFLTTSEHPERGRVGALLPWVARAAQFAVLASCALIFWGLFGSFGPDGFYVPAFMPRVTAVSSSQRSAHARDERAPAELTLGIWPGARVRLGGATLCAISPEGEAGGLATATRPCRVPAASPFERLAVPSGRYDVRISPSAGTDELGIAALALDSGIETRLVSTGPTLDFEVLEQQTRLRAQNDARAFDFDSKRMLGFPVLDLVLGSLALAALLKMIAALGSSSIMPARSSSSRNCRRFVAGASVSSALAPLFQLRFLWSARTQAVVLAGLFGSLLLARWTWRRRRGHS